MRNDEPKINFSTVAYRSSPRETAYCSYDEELMNHVVLYRNKGLNKNIERY